MRKTLCIVGLGYVGLPLAYAFAKKGYKTYGYDIAEQRIQTLRDGHDWTNELSAEQLRSVSIDYTTDPSVIRACDVVILALPTPVDDDNNPDLTPVLRASEMVGKYLKKGAIVVYESTVYPGVTEEMCGPILERESGMVCGRDFTLGYSPERINPGDKEHTVEKITKIVAGQDAKTLDTVAELYGSIVTAGIHRAPSIKVAEMAKAIENAQRDINIAFINEIALLCHRIGIATKDVLDAARTKWNFLPFTPGLVGGHCIGVDPYYLVEKARQLGMQTHIITAGRAINDGMAQEVAKQVINALEVKPDQARVLVLGLTFKENIPDARNSKVFDVILNLKKHACTVFINEPYASLEDKRRAKEAGAEEGQSDLRSFEENPVDALLLLVPHNDFLDTRGRELMIKALKRGGLFYDLKSIVDSSEITAAGRRYLAL